MSWINERTNLNCTFISFTIASYLALLSLFLSAPYSPLDHDISYSPGDSSLGSVSSHDVLPFEIQFERMRFFGLSLVVEEETLWSYNTSWAALH